MAANIPELKAQYRLLAEIEAPDTQAAQKTWLLARFRDECNGGVAEVTQLSLEGSSSGFQFRGSTSEERRAALRQAIEDITAEIAGDLSAQGSPCLLIPFFNTRFGL